MHLIERDPSSPYQRPIISDAKGYYAYLPALIIYQDFEYEFLAEMDEKYYKVGQDKHIFIEQNGRRVNKTFPGVALLYLPFFLIAHFLASLLDLPADGYSDIYQYLFDFGQFFYATLGLLLMGNVFKLLGFTKKSIILSIVLVALGTNLWYYIVYDQSVTHVYNFFLINALVFYALRLKVKADLLGLSMTAGILSLLIIIRPTGVLSLLIVLFFIPEKRFYINLFSRLKSPKVLLPILMLVGGILSLPLLLWKVQSGNWLVYSYGEEGFDFSNPHLMEFLFSYAKGWWLYSPLVLVVIFYGILLLLKTEMGKLKVAILILFLMVTVYIFSSWWCWWYGFSFGQRPMVDFYILIGYLMAVIIQRVNASKTKQIILGTIALLLVFLNLLQSYQHHHGFFQWSQPNSEIYWDNFLRIKKQAKIYLEEDWNLLESETFEFDDATGCVKCQGIIFTDVNKPFSESVVVVSPIMKESDFVVISFNAIAHSDLSNTDLVVEYKGDQSSYRNYNFNEYVSINQSSFIQLRYDAESSKKDSLVVYFWNKDSDQIILVDFMKFDFYRSKN